MSIFRCASCYSTNMNATQLKKIFLLFLTSGVYTALFSQGYQVNFQGQKQQGMASAGTALPQDASTVFFNPGAASFIEKGSVEIAMTPVFGNTLFEEDSTGVTGRTNSPMGKPFSLYALFRNKKVEALSYGIGVYTPFGSTIQYEDGWVGRFALTRLELMSIFVQPTISYQLNDKFGIGAGFVYCIGRVNLQKDIPVLDQTGEYSHAELSASASGMGVNAGVYFKASEKLSFGLTYRSKVTMGVADGSAEFTVPEALASNFPNGSFSSELPLPQVITLGAAIIANENLSIAADINYIGWSAYDTLAFDYVNNTESLEDTRSARNYENTFAFRLGGQYKLSDLLSVRLGLAYGMTPVQNGYVTPETPDADRISYTGGLSLNLHEHFDIDLSLLYTHVKRWDHNIETNLTGKYTTKVVAPGFALRYKF